MAQIQTYAGADFLVLEVAAAMSDEQNPWVIRTDFSNQAAWDHVCKLISEPQTADKFLAYVRFVSDERWRAATPDTIFAAVDGSPAGFGFAVDRRCLDDPEHPVLVLGTALSWDELAEDDDDDPPMVNLSFRALPSAVQSIENNVSIGNMGLEEFADSVDADGVFRGFSER